MNSRNLPYGVIASFAFLSLAGADTITLQDGTKLEGQILSQTDSAVVIEYSATATIKDQKTVSRDQIAKIVSIPKDDKAFVDLGDLASPATVLDTAYYDPLVETKIPAFLTQYPYSRHISELREDLRILSAERARIKSGDRKINGNWISSAQIKNDPYGFGALIQFSRMKALAESNDPVGALQVYELLEQNYPGSSVMPDAADLALKQIALLQGNLNVAKANFAVIDKNRQGAIAVAPADQAKQLKDSIEKERLSAKASMAAATADGTKFFPVFQNNKEAMDALQALINAENTRLLHVQELPMRNGIKASEECAKLLAEGKTKEAQEQLDLSIKLWPANIQNAKLRQQIDDLAKIQAAAAQKTTPSPVTPKL
jgi:hypothetical protein